MIVMAMRSSTTARVSRKDRSADGRCVPMTASTARAKAMSVAVGMAQPPSTSPDAVAEAAGDGEEDQGRHGHAAHRGGDRQRRLGRVAQVADHELALELEPGDEEEDREQAVGGPLLEGEVQVQRGRADGQSRSAV